MDNILKLHCHKKTPAQFIQAMEVSYEISSDGLLKLRYAVDVPHSALVIAQIKEPLRTDFLWHTTCCEVFLGIKDKPEYIEYNFSPSSQWAAYQFTDYRKDVADLDVLAVPEISIESGHAKFALEAAVMLPHKWQQAYLNTGLDVGLTVVAEEQGGKNSYWSLAHHQDEPEFHDRSCFTLPLKATGPV